MAMLRVDGAGFGRHRAGEAQLVGDLGFPAAASARIAIRIGEMGDVRTEQSLEIDLVVGHLATSLPGLERGQRCMGGRVGADRNERVAGQRAELVAIQEIFLRQRCGRNAVRRKGRRKLEFPAIVLMNPTGRRFQRGDLAGQIRTFEAATHALDRRLLVRAK